MGFLFLLLLLGLSVLGLFEPGPRGQVLWDLFVLAGVLLLPVIRRRRRRGGAILEARAKRPSRSPGSGSGIPLPGQAQSRALPRMAEVWTVLVVLAYLVSLGFSQHAGMSLHGFRQVIAGVIAFGVLIHLRYDFDASLDSLLGLSWLLWLVAFLGPIWAPVLPKIWENLANPLPVSVLFEGEIEPMIAAWGVIALECWLVASILIPQRFGRKLPALAAHSLLWAVWGGLGSAWLFVFAGIALAFAVAAGPMRLPRYGGWALATAAFGAAAAWCGRVYFPLGAEDWILAGKWAPPFGTAATIADYQAAFFRFPLGLGALGHQAVREVFGSTALLRPIPGGQQLLWMADLGLWGPLLSAALLAMLVWSVRFVGRAYPEPAEPSRDPEAMRRVKEREDPLAPVVLPSTLLAWWTITLIQRDLDLFRSAVFWIYLGLWVAWLSGVRPEGEGKPWRVAKVVVLAVLVFQLATLVGMREMGRTWFERGQSAKTQEEREKALQTAQTWDRFNPEHPISLAKEILAKGRRQPSGVTSIRGIRYAERGLSLAPASSEGHMLLSRYHRAEGHLPEAILEAERAVFYQPQRAEFHWELAGLYESTGRLEAAARQFRLVVNLRPLDVDAHLALGRVAEKNRRYAEALKAYRQVLLLERDQPTARARYEALRESQSRNVL